MKLYEPFQFLTTDECDEIISYGNPRKKRAGTLIGKENQNLRNNRVVWYTDRSRWQEWIAMFNTIDPVVDWIEDPQIAFYKPGEEYKWHADTWTGYTKHIRYFSLACELQSAPGGAIELENKSIPPLKKGQAVIFKSQDRHRATSPTEGERISLTIWARALNLVKR
jgi:hypothetical protein